ncbi:YD repeat-containing protein [Alteromonadaceae bacterium 2753L.S.0a.02]|nr:YD repeat-containing protein [Alteromonadaceae bacterium 2753L.S.0a.02]
MGSGIHSSVASACEAHRLRMQQISEETASNADNWENRSLWQCTNIGASDYTLVATKADTGNWQSTLLYVPQKIECNEDETLNADTLTCVPPVYCDAGYALNEAGDTCEAWCENGESWSDDTQSCITDEEPQDCENTTSNPINILNGLKYRTEFVHKTGIHFPIVLSYNYNSQRGKEQLGSFSLASGSQRENVFLAATHPPRTSSSPSPAASVYDLLYNGEKADSANLNSYWRHNYQEALYPRIDGSYAWHKSDGQIIRFNSSGQSSLYSKISITSLNNAEIAQLGFEGHKLVTGSNKPIKIFDDKGQLRQIFDKSTKVYHKLIYNQYSQLSRIEHSNGAYLEFSYNAVSPLSHNTASDMVAYYPNEIVDEQNRRVLLEWGYSYTGSVQSFLLLTKISRLTEQLGNTFRAFYYENETYPANLTRIEDVLDHNIQLVQPFAQFTYDDLGRATYSALANGVDAVTIDYVDDLTRTVTNVLGKQATYNFTSENGVKRLTSVVGEPTATCVRSETSYTYNSDGTRASKVTNGVTTTYGYNASKQRTLVTEAAGTAEARTTTTEWHPTLNVRTKIIEPDKTTRYDYNDTTELLDAVHIDADGKTRSTAYTYYANRLVHTVDGPRTDVADITTYAYDEQLNLASVTNAANQTTLYSNYNGQGQAGTVTDANGSVSQYSYDVAGRVETVSVQHPSGNTSLDLSTVYDYDPLGNLVTMTFADGSSLSYEYDAANRIEAISNNLGERIELTLDKAGNTTQQLIKNSSGVITFQAGRAYDELSRVIRQVGAAGQTTHFGYDANDNLTQTTDGREFVTNYEYDTLNRVTKTLQPLGITTEMGYNPADQLQTVTDPETLKTQYHYNGFGELTQRISPDTGTTDYTYDSAGNLTSKADARGIVALYSYDALNRVTSIEYPNDTTQNITYEYDDTSNGNYGIGRLTAIIDASGETRFAYDYLGNLLSKTTTIATQTFTSEYQYDAFGRLQTQVYPSGRLVHYSYDALSRIHSITTQANSSAPLATVITDVSYLPYGPATQWTYGNGIVHTTRYDLDYRVSSIEDDGSSPLYHLSYGYDANNNIETLDNLVNSVAAQMFSYDAVDRLDTAQGNYGALDYDYDKVGNRTQKQHTQGGNTNTESYSYALTSHQLQAVTNTQGGNRTFSYDANGNVLTDTHSNSLVWEYDDTNRPKAVTVNGERIEYRHNALGQRVFKQHGNTTTFYHYDESGKVVAVSDEIGRFIDQIIWFNNTAIAFINNPELDMEDSDNDGLLDNWEISVIGDLSLDRYSDTDSDGLPDYWEYQYFSGLAQNASGDHDEDGLSNLQEFNQGSNPKYPPYLDSLLQYSSTLILDFNDIAIGQQIRNRISNQVIGNYNSTVFRTLSGSGVESPDVSAGFNGIDSKLEFQSTILPSVSKDEFTLGFWIKHSEKSNGFHNLISNATNEWNDGFGLVVSESGAPRFWAYTSNGLIDVSGGQLSLNQWAHLVVSYDYGSVKIFINGTLAASQSPYSFPVSIIYSSERYLSIGGQNKPYKQSERYFRGNIDNLFVTEKALTEAEVQKLYEIAEKNISLNTDYDNDGMPDTWEIQYFGDLSASPEQDNDGDGLTNLVESQKQLNPLYSGDTEKLINLGGSMILNFNTADAQKSILNLADLNVVSTLNETITMSEPGAGVNSPDSSIAFNGTTSFITLNASVNDIISNNTFTGGGWVKLSPKTTGLHYLFGNAYNEWNDGYGLFVTPAGELSFWAYTNQGLLEASASGVNFNDWQHLAFSYDKGEIKLFINGAIKTTSGTPNNTYQINYSSSRSFTIGSQNKSYLKQERFLLGNIDSIFIVDRKLSESEIASLVSQ